MPDYSNFSSQEICGISTIFMIFAIGISCLVISVVGFFDEEAFECGRNGKPPLIIWIFGTGIAFTVISCAFWRVGSGKGGALAKWILGVTNIFVVVWAIVGFLSMFKYERECRDNNPAVWSMAWATVVISFMICCCGGFVGYNVATTEAEIVSEEEEP